MTGKQADWLVCAALVLVLLMDAEGAELKRGEKFFTIKK